ncbi:MAG: S24 family peptidase, partial [Alphaproteobacteria bacterium]|nr:S24 family peptidase [Alphaproteobacteria bacterium]
KVTKNQIAPSAFDKKLSSAPFMPGSMRENEPSLQEGFGYYPIHELDTIAGASQEHLHKYKKLEPPFPIPTANLQETSYSDIKNLYIIRIFGDGMEPTLSDGNRVVIDTGITKPDKPGIYALWNDTGLTIKRLQSLSNGMVQLVADNKNYPLETAALKDLKIKGRIILIVSQMV